LKGSQFKFLFILGFFQTALQYFFFYNGLANTTGVKGSILTTLGVFFIVLVSHFVYHNDKLNIKKIIGLVLGFAGVVIVNLNQGRFDFSFVFVGEGFIILSQITSTIAVLMVKSISKNIEPLLITAYQMFMGSIILFAISLAGVSPFSLSFSVSTFLLLLYLALLSAIAFGLWYSLIKYNLVGYISIYKFIVPVSGVFLSTIFVPAENITFNIIIALIFVSLGIIMINLRWTSPAFK